MLDTAFREIVDTGGDMQAFRQRWGEGRWWWLSTAKQAAVYGGHNIYQTCVKAREQGLID